VRKENIKRHRALTEPTVTLNTPDINSAQALLTPKQTADLLGVTEGTLSVWRSAHRYPLTYIKVGGRVMYRFRDIEQFIANRAVNPTPIDHS
jgi:hypothetical protein